MHTTQVIFEGRVQGVFFRATAREIATRFDVSGWVRNEPDGTVHLVAQGDPDEVERYLDALIDAKRGNISNSIVTQLASEETLQGFTIRR
ncbi:MAG: acylphosphatase [Phycisphaerales bacterium JB043]